MLWQGGQGEAYKKRLLSCSPGEVSAQVNVKVRPYFTAGQPFHSIFGHISKRMPTGYPLLPFCIFSFPFVFLFHLAFLPILFPFFRVVSTTYSEFSHILNQRDKKHCTSQPIIVSKVSIFASLLSLGVTLLPHLSQ